MASSSDVLKKVKKDYGEGMADQGAVVQQLDRIPTGIFPLDLATGGGLIMGRINIVYGPESSNKSNICMKAAANAQALIPDKKVVWVDAEGTYDPVWAKKMGVDVDNIILVRPFYAEQAIDIMEGFIYADDVSMIVLDSIAMLSTQNEIESSVEKASVGGASLLVGRWFKKMVSAFNNLNGQGKTPPALVGINQIRHKIGVMFGDPETMPGGNGVKFSSSLTIRCYGKNIMDNKIHPAMPAFKEVNFIVKKWKVPIVQVNGVFKMQMLDGGGGFAGQVADWNTVQAYLKELGLLTQTKTGWSFDGGEYKTLLDLKNFLYASVSSITEVRSHIIKAVMDSTGTLSTEESEE